MIHDIMWHISIENEATYIISVIIAGECKFNLGCRILA